MERHLKNVVSGGMSALIFLTPLFASAATQEEIAARIQALLVQIEVLQQKLNALTQGTQTGDLSASSSSGVAPLTVAFSWPSTVDLKGGCPTIDFGDGQISNAADHCPTSAAHTYTAPGTY